MMSYSQLWCWLGQGDDTHIYIEHPRTGETVVEPIRTARYEFAFGKYKGQRMSAVTDIAYLRFLVENMSKDWFLMQLVKLRLKEIGRVV